MDHSRIAASRDVLPLMPDDLELARPPRQHTRFPNVNLLLVGPDDAVEQVLAYVKAERLTASDGHVAVWQPGKPFVLPSPDSTSILILRAVDTLVHGDQQKLLDWLGRSAGRVQVLSTAATSLMPLVDAGVFMQTLYYRLNTIYMDLRDPGASPADW